MPYIDRRRLPKAVRKHLEERVKDRSISEDDMILLANWIKTNPEVPHGEWCKEFGAFTLAGEGAIPKTFLKKGQPCKGMVDERARRMVEFLAQCELDISLLTFHGFKQDGEILLARKVEVQAPRQQQGTRTRVNNQAKLDRLLASLGTGQNYQALVEAVKQGLGTSAYQSPNPNGYSFSLPEVSDAGQALRSYVALYTPEHQKGRIQIFLQKRAVDAAGDESVKQAAKAMGSQFILKPSGYGEIWIDGHKSVSANAATLTALSQTIASGWATKMENQAAAEVEEATNNA